MAVAAGIAVALVLNVGFYLLFPDVAALGKTNPQKTSFMEFREREWRQQGKENNIRYFWTPLAQISPYVVKAVLIAEDDKFWSHEGFDFEAMTKAMEKDIKRGSLRAGGSTVSQQLAKNLYLTPSRNLIRKIKEAVLTWRIEHSLSKRRIIELYLNVAEWGEGIFGIGAAARHYYGKSASELEPMEAARLAAVLPNPRRLDPTGPSSYVEHRSQQIYRIMVRRGIVIEEYEAVMSAPQEETEDEAPEFTEEREVVDVQEKSDADGNKDETVTNVGSLPPEPEPLNPSPEPGT